MSRESEIVSFITARLDEEGQAAQAAAEEADDATWSPGGHFSEDVRTDRTGTAVVVGPWAGGYLADELRDHIAGQDPARTLRRVAAMRKLLEAHVGYYGPGDDEFFPIPTLRILAAIWDDHEDYPEALKAEGARDA